MRPLLAMFLLLVAAPALAGHPLDEPFALNVSQSLVIGDDALQVGFVGVIEDSRCPVDVTCVWGGDVIADLWLQVAGEPVQSFVLHLARQFPYLITVGDYTLTLLQVLPARYQDVPIEPDDYVVRLVVQQGVVTADVATWGAVKAWYR